MLAWLMGTRLGRWVMGMTAGLVAIIVLLWQVFAAGRKAERADQAEQSLENLREREKTDDEVAAMPAADRRKRLREWVRDGQ